MDENARLTLAGQRLAAGAKYDEYEAAWTQYNDAGAAVGSQIAKTGLSKVHRALAAWATATERYADLALTLQALTDSDEGAAGTDLLRTFFAQYAKGYKCLRQQARRHKDSVQYSPSERACSRAQRMFSLLRPSDEIEAVRRAFVEEKLPTDGFVIAEQKKEAPENAEKAEGPSPPAPPVTPEKTSPTPSKVEPEKEVPPAPPPSKPESKASSASGGSSAGDGPAKSTAAAGQDVPQGQVSDDAIVVPPPPVAPKPPPPPPEVLVPPTPWWRSVRAIIAIVFLLVAAVGIVVAFIPPPPPPPETLSSCIANGLAKESNIKNDSAAQIGGDYARLVADAGPAAFTLTKGNTTAIVRQALNDENQGKVIDACAAHFGVHPPDVETSVLVTTNGQPLSKVHVFNKATLTEDCTTAAQTGACALLIHRADRPKYTLVAQSASFLTGSVEKTRGELLDGVPIDLVPSKRKAVTVHVLDAQGAGLPGAEVSVVSSEATADIRSDSCEQQGQVSADCLKETTNGSGDVRFVYGDGLGPIDLRVGYQSSLQVLRHIDSARDIPAYIELNWGRTGLTPSAGHPAATPALSKCSEGTKSALTTAADRARSKVPPGSPAKIMLQVQVGPQGSVLSVSGDQSNSLFGPVSTALRGAALEHRACETDLTWQP